MKGKKGIIFVLVTALCFSMMTVGSFGAEQTDSEVKADALKMVNLFAGTNRGDQLHRQPNRVESLVMLIRLMGEEASVKSGHYTHPFKDVPEWADHYVGYAYENEIVRGMSDTDFGSGTDCSLQQYLTLVLRALGVPDDGTLYENAAVIAEEKGLLDGAVNRNHFGRGEMVQVSYQALNTAVGAAGEEGLLGETLVQKGVCTQEQLQKARSRVSEGPRQVRAVFLTFDDGPSAKVTPRILATLKEYDVQATFFLAGSMVDANPALVKQEYAEGHKLANHSYSHNYGYIYKNGDRLLGEIYQCDEAIGRALGFPYRTGVFRFPGGSHQKSKTLKNAVTNAGYRYYDWNCAGNDAVSRKPVSAAYVYSSTVSTTPRSGDVIVLYHDTNAKSSTAEALPMILDYFLSQGFVFRTL